MKLISHRHVTAAQPAGVSSECRGVKAKAKAARSRARGSAGRRARRIRLQLSTVLERSPAWAASFYRRSHTRPKLGSTVLQEESKKIWGEAALRCLLRLGEAMPAAALHTYSPFGAVFHPTATL